MNRFQLIAGTQLNSLYSNCHIIVMEWKLYTSELNLINCQKLSEHNLMTRLLEHNLMSIYKKKTEKTQNV